MNKIHIHRRSSLLASVPLLLQLSLTAPGCVEPVDETGDYKEAAPSTVPILVYDPSRQGRVQSALAAAGANFVTDNYEAVIINVGGSDAATLVPVVTRFLDEGHRVVLDSNGELAERIVVGELTGAVAGLAAQETALSIARTAPGAFTVTPIVDPTVEISPGEDSSGNTFLAVLGDSDAAADADHPISGDVTTVAGTAAAAAADTITKYSYQGRGKPTPPIVPSYVDNQATHVRTGSSGSLLKRYVYRGEPQACPRGGTNNCVMTWGKSFTKSVAQGTSISVNFANKLTEKLTGGVTLGYSLTVTTAQTLTWSNAVNIKPGWTARPVSYLHRQNGYGNVKNAYIFQSRRKVHSPCRPSGGCYAIHDTYVRQPNTVVGSWSANVVVNQGATTNSWNTYNGALDPNVYVFD